MSAPAETLKFPAKAEAIVTFTGRIDDVNETQDSVYTDLALASEDVYAMPPMVAIRSIRRLGKKGDEITVKVRCGGYPKKSREGKRYVTNTYNAVE